MRGSRIIKQDYGIIVARCILSLCIALIGFKIVYQIYPPFAFMPVVVGVVYPIVVITVLLVENKKVLA